MVWVGKPEKHRTRAIEYFSCTVFVRSSQRYDLFCVLTDAQNPLDTFPPSFSVNGEVANLLWASYGETGVMDFGLDCATFRTIIIQIWQCMHFSENFTHSHEKIICFSNTYVYYRNYCISYLS